MERISNDGATIEVFENDIEYYLEEFKEKQNIEDLRQVPQSVWNAALMYVNRHVFKPNQHLLKSNTNYNTGIYNNNINITTNYNMYNYDLVSKVVDYYIYLCLMYNKEVSIIGFSNLTGIDTDTINEWGNNSNRLSTSCSVIYKKLSKMREESLSNKLADGKQNPVGILAILNRHYSWNLPGVSRENAKAGALTAAELPKLGGKMSAVHEQITQKDAVIVDTQNGE